MDEPTLSSTRPVLLRLEHAKYFLQEYLRHSGPPIDSYFLMIGYFDAFLFALGSVGEMASREERARLNACQSFCFFKVLRNVTTHHSILAATIAGSKFPRPFSREVTASTGGPSSDSSRLRFRLDVLRDILAAVEREFPREKRNLSVAREYISGVERRGPAPVYLDDLMSQALEEAGRAVRCVTMFDGIDEKRVLNMTDREKRLLDNARKAFHDSDLAMQSGCPEDQCLESLLKALDIAKTLRRSLRGEDASHHSNRERFLEFLGLEVPAFGPDAGAIELRDRQTGKLCSLTLGEIVYAIRCKMVHENENLNAAEGEEHHIALDWSVRNPLAFAELCDRRCVLNGFFLWSRLRELLSKFITGTQGMIDFAQRRSFSIGTEPQLGSIKPLKRGGDNLSE